MLLASEGGKNKSVEGTISLNFLKDPTRPALEERSGDEEVPRDYGEVREGRERRATSYHVYGMAVAYETVALSQAPGRESDPRGADGPSAVDHERRRTRSCFPGSR